MDAQFTAKPAGWKIFQRAVKENFAGKHNEALRRRIYKLADSGAGLTGLERSVAFTASGKTSLRICDQLLADWDGRNATRETEARQFLK